ncbi:MAG: trigger factor [Thermaerobacterales bacterium]
MPAVDMKATLEKVEENRAHLQVEVADTEVGTALDKAYRKIAREVMIPGFRKGRAPRAILERHVGKGAFYEEALDELLPQAYAGAVEITEIQPIDQPEITDVDIEEGKPLRFSLKVEVKPEVDPGDYRGVKVAKEDRQVTEEEIETVLQSLQERHAQLVAVEDANAAVEEGHDVTLDFKGSLAGEPIEGGEAENFTLTVGSGQLLPDFESQLVGMKVGETKEIQVGFPDDYPQPKLAGKTVDFDISLKEIKRRDLPALDDELAKTVGPFDSLTALREDVQNRLEQNAAEEAIREHRQQVIQAVVDQVDLNVPEVLIKRRFERVMEEFKQRMQKAGLQDIDDYLAIQNQDRAEFEAELRERAERDTKTDLVLEAIADREEIKPSDIDFRREARVLAGNYGQPVEQMETLMRHPEVRSEVVNAVVLRKTVDFLARLAEGTDAEEAKAAMEREAEEAEAKDRESDEAAREAEAQQASSEDASKGPQLVVPGQSEQTGGKLIVPGRDDTGQAGARSPAEGEAADAERRQDA